MVVEVRLKDGSRNKYCKVKFCGVLMSYQDKLYIQTSVKGNFKEVFINLASIESYHVRNPI